MNISDEFSNKNKFNSKLTNNPASFVKNKSKGIFSKKEMDVKITNDLKIKVSQNPHEQKPVSNYSKTNSKREKIKNEIKEKRQREINLENNEKKRPKSSNIQKVNKKEEILRENKQKAEEFIQKEEMDDFNDINHEEIPNTDNHIIKTIKKISNNPDKFKLTNQILKGIGELSSKNYNISYQLSNKEEMISKTQNIQRKTIEKEIYSSAINSNVTPKENLKNDRQDNFKMMNIICKKTETEQKKMKKLITEKAKEIENEKKFVINNKNDRKLLEKKSDYEYKTEEKLASIFVPKIREKDKIEKDILLKASVTSIEESQNARKILENVFKKVESNIQRMSEITERNQENGYIFSAYEGLFKKARNLKDENVFGDKKKGKITKDEVYNHLYMKKDIERDPSSSHPWIIND